MRNANPELCGCENYDQTSRAMPWIEVEQMSIDSRYIEVFHICSSRTDDLCFLLTKTGYVSLSCIGGSNNSGIHVEKYTT
jgi:hypothetical protein